MNPSRFRVLFCLAFMFLLSSAAWPQPHAPTISLAVDASEAPRKLFHAQLKIPASPGTLTLYYPKWIPGEHGPTAPIQDHAGLKYNAKRQTLKSRRDQLRGRT